ncbi:indoleamine 2, 3-dioxyganeseb [Moniliophthora roreri]|nr:indoleamine 2, 3-dioxyganeseb [Moniliophthora roreri]
MAILWAGDEVCIRHRRRASCGERAIGARRLINWVSQKKKSRPLNDRNREYERPQTHPSSPPRSRLDPPFLRTYAHTTIGFRTHEDPTAAPRCWLHLFSDKTIITTGQSVRFRAKSTHHRPSRIALVHLFASSSSDLLQMTPLLVTVVPLVKGQANEIV